MRERMRGSKGCFGIINANSFDDAQKLSYMDLASISTYSLSLLFFESFVPPEIMHMIDDLRHAVC